MTAQDQKLRTDEEQESGEIAGNPHATGRAPSLGQVQAGIRWLLFHNPMVIILIALMIASQLLYPGFFDPVNLRNMAIQNADIALVALGMTVVMIAGGFDLSVGAIYALGTVVSATYADSMPWVMAALLALTVGLVCGLANGLIITRLRVNAFIATLGAGSVYSGLAYLLSDSQSIVPKNPNFRWIVTETWLTVPVAACLVIMAFVFVGFVMSRSVYGRNLYALGGNEEAARLAGLAVQRLRVSTYMLVGACAAGGGVIIAARSSVGQANIGESIPLAAIAIVIVGGTSLFGGDGSIARTVVGVAVLAVINNLFNRMAVSVAPQLIAQGLIVVAAVALDVVTRRRRT